MIYGDSNSGRAAFVSGGFKVKSILYNDNFADDLITALLKFDAILVWVNPIEQGNDRKKLDSLLAEISGKGCFVSTHPEVILKMGTKDVLYKTKDMSWGGDIKMYKDYDDFKMRFPESLQISKTRVLKQHRGNGGNGVFKISLTTSGDHISVTHAKDNHEERILSWKDFYNEFKAFFLNNGLLIDQEWNDHSVNGMVRCYLSGTTVAGFGYQEINALYELNSKTHLPPGKRYYFTENCGLFDDLKQVIENEWVPQLQQNLSIADNEMPVIWDADFFINKVNSEKVNGKYSLCEINVSCVSPFPPSSIRFMVDEVSRRIKNKKLEKM